jgi:hypothetical protein
MDASGAESVACDRGISRLYVQTLAKVVLQVEPAGGLDANAWDHLRRSREPASAAYPDLADGDGPAG